MKSTLTLDLEQGELGLDLEGPCWSLWITVQEDTLALSGEDLDELAQALKKLHSFTCLHRTCLLHELETVPVESLS